MGSTSTHRTTEAGPVCIGWFPPQQIPQWKRHIISFIYRIIVLDKTWVRAYELELKYQPTKFAISTESQIEPNRVKVMLIVACQGIILTHVVSEEKSVNADYNYWFQQHHLRLTM
ncbi:hypothetical protein NPIL_607121 [Nephila pilipes]|uniref:Uncharacterized protein n=1 Tax=Nephila pilipes TaxID=299642 RepID=A0A8X6ITW6_NEPPI|nr:hypothetical protein NPIL_607121 [Nephila pilipes]